MTSTSRAIPLLASLTDVDDLLTRTRSLQPAQRARRDAWLEGLALESKHDTLFELEVLLKASACFASPRNHAGQSRHTPLVARDFRRATELFRDGMCRVVALCQQLVGQRAQAVGFRRYLELGVRVSTAHTEHTATAAPQPAPEDSLVMLRQGLTSVIEVLAGTLRAQHVTYRTFYAALTLVKREVGRNAYFNPLLALEFRPEFDRIANRQLLDVIANVPTDEARHLVALTFLSLNRLLKYVQLLERLTLPSETQDDRDVGTAYLVLSVLRSDARALGQYLRQGSGQLLCSTFERALFTATASRLVETAGQLRSLGQRLVGVRAALDGIAGSLHLEMRRVFAHELPAIEEKQARNEFFAGLHVAIEGLRPALRHLVLALGSTLGTELDERCVFAESGAKREASARLRRDVWVLERVVRAFTERAEEPQNLDRWSAPSNLRFVDEFLTSFRALGYPVLRASAYPRFEALVEVTAQLEGSDPILTTTLARATQECRAFRDFLVQLFDRINCRSELARVPFDEWTAQTTLRFYLAD